MDDGDGSGGVRTAIRFPVLQKGDCGQIARLFHYLLTRGRITAGFEDGGWFRMLEGIGQAKEDLVGFTPQSQGEVTAVGGKAGEDRKSRPPPPDLWSSSSPADRRGGFSDLRPLTSDLWHLDVFEQDRGAIQGVGDGGQFQFGADRFFDGFEPALLGGCGDEFVEVHGVCFRCDALRKCVAPGMGICQYIRSGFGEIIR